MLKIGQEKYNSSLTKGPPNMVHTDFDDLKICCRGHTPDYPDERFCSNGP